MNVVISSSTLGSGLVYEEGMLHDWRVKRRLGSDNMLDAGFVRDYKAASLLDALLNMDVPLMRARVSLGAAVMQRTRRITLKGGGSVRFEGIMREIDPETLFHWTWAPFWDPEEPGIHWDFIVRKLLFEEKLRAVNHAEIFQACFPGLIEEE